MLDRHQTREWTHGLTAIILGLFLLGVGSNLGISKTAVDLLGGMLSIPEYPAVILRDAFQNWRGWTRNREALQEEIARLREENATFRILDSALKNEALRAQIDARLEEAKVTLRAPMSWWNEIRIDRGGKGSGDRGVAGLSRGVPRGPDHFRLLALFVGGAAHLPFADDPRCD